MISLRQSIASSSIPLRQQVPRKFRSFHATLICCKENFYQTLGLEPGASAEAIKKQFYSLSKTHHPDHNPNDPHASERFVKISEAYATIGNAQKRERYDRDVLRTQQGSSHPVPQGSHSSSSTAFGSRPASGLSRRRTQFKGPPPSFYRNGAWGSHGARRQSQAQGQTAASGASAKTSGGFSPGQGQAGLDNDVPHFDHHGHYRTQQSQEQRRRSKRREEPVEYGDGGADAAMRFLLISGIVGLAFMPLWSYKYRRDLAKAKEKSSDG